MLLRRFGPGAPAPSAVLVAGLVLALGAVAVLAPLRVRGPRVQIAAAALLQPVLHGLFEIAPHEH